MPPKSVPVPMIRRVRIENFRSIAKCDVELGPLTILVGPNGSGKSNFLHALDFLADALTNGLESAVKRRGGITSLMSRWALDDFNSSLEIEVELTLHSHRIATYGFALARVGNASYWLVDEHCTVRSDRDEASPERPPTAEFVRSDNETAWRDSPAFQLSPRPTLVEGNRMLMLPHLAGHPLYRPVLRTLLGLSFYSVLVDQLRAPRERESDEQLASDGSNAAAVFERMQAENQRGWRPADAVIGTLGVVTPGVAGISVATIDGYQAIRFEQETGRDEPPQTFTASEMSYGTLRTFGVLVALYQGSMAGGSPVTLVGIEEPESAVHPGVAPVLLEAMQEAALTTQVLATTHSVAMLEHENLDISIVRAVSRRDGRTVIGPVDSVSRGLVEDQLYTAGELLRTFQLTPETDIDHQASAEPVILPT